jgi:hypothetical protein
MNRCCAVDVLVFGHTRCTLRPPWAVSDEAAFEHYDADIVLRNQWSTQAYGELRKIERRGAVRAA